MHLLDGHDGLFAAKRRLAEPQAKDGHAQRIEIGGGRQLAIGAPFDDRGAHIHFRGSINRGAVLQGRSLAVFEHYGNAKVAKHAVPSLSVVNQNVGRLHVTMNEAQAMAGIQGQSRFDSNFQNRVRVDFQVNGTDGTCWTIFHQLKLPLLALIVHGAIVVQVDEIALAVEQLHQRQHGGIIARATFIHFQHLTVLHDNIGLRTQISWAAIGGGSGGALRCGRRALGGSCSALRSYRRRLRSSGCALGQRG